MGELTATRETSRGGTAQRLRDDIRGLKYCLLTVVVAFLLLPTSFWFASALFFRQRCDCWHSLQAADPPVHALAPLDPALLAMASSQQPVLERPVMVLFGDSLTQYSFEPEGGWGAALAHLYQRRVDVINRGHSGYNSRWALKVMEQLAKQLQGQKVLMMTLWLGANDGAIPDRAAKVQHVPIKEYRSNLERIIQLAQGAGVSNIVLMTPPPVYDEGRIKHQQQKMGISTPVLPDRTLDYMQQYADTVLELSTRHKLPVVDLYKRLQLFPNWQTQLLKDGLHFTTAGSMAVWQELHEVITTQLPQLSLDRLPTQFPLWDRLAVDDFEQYWLEELPKMQAGHP